MLVQLLPALAATGVQLATGVGPTTIGAGQVVVVQELLDVAELCVQVCTGTFVVLLVEQVVVVQLLPDEAVTGVQVWTGVFADPTIVVAHVVVT